MSDDKKGTTSDINLDKILIEEVGQFGKFQKITLFVVSIAVLFSGFGSTDFVFTTASLPTRCRIPGCDDTEPEWEPAWLGNAIPGTPGNYDQCNRYANISAIIDVPPNTCPAELFDRENSISCQSYVHNRTNSVVYDFGLECDDWKRSFIGTSRTVASLIFIPIVGAVSDRFGRRIVLATAILVAIFGFVRAFVNDYVSYLILHGLENSFHIYGTGAILVTEFVGPKYRVVAGPMLSSFSALGFVIGGCIAWAVNEWRNLTIALFAPQLTMVALYWLVPESIRWQLAKGKIEEAEKSLRKVARINKTTLSEESIQKLRDYHILHNKDIEDRPKEPLLLLQVLKSKVILYRCFVATVTWISTIMVYYGLGINSISLAGNQYLNFILVSAIEIPGFITAMFVLNRIGRRMTLFSGFFTCSMCQFAFAFMGNEYPGLTLAVYMIGKYSISLVVTSLYVYTQELFPTKCRHSLVAFASTMGRLGSIIASVTPALVTYYAGAPSIIFGVMTFLSAGLVMTNPETLGTKLPDTIEEAENIHKSV